MKRNRRLLRAAIMTIGGYRVWLLKRAYRNFVSNTLGQVVFGAWMGWGLGLLIF